MTVIIMEFALMQNVIAKKDLQEILVKIKVVPKIAHKEEIALKEFVIAIKGLWEM
jgi:hypothetical protein